MRPAPADSHTTIALPATSTLACHASLRRPAISGLAAPRSAGVRVRGSSARLAHDLQRFVGTLKYYRMRETDFAERHPGERAPDYYLGYGDKYVRRFLLETYSELSPRGRAWDIETARLLQQAIEDARQRDPAAFDALERDGKALRDFAYSTHARAYLRGGLDDLPLRDLLRIATTPDLEDLVTVRGVEQVVETGAGLARAWVDHALGRPHDWLESEDAPAGAGSYEPVPCH